MLNACRKRAIRTQRKSFIEKFCAARQIIEDVKSLTGEEVIGAGVLLCNAGYNYAAWVVSYDEGDFYLDADKSCKKAIFETTKLGIIYCSEGIKVFRDTYDTDDLVKLIPNYTQKMKIVNDANKSVIAYEKEKNNIVDCVGFYYDIRKIYDEFMVCKPELQKSRRKSRNNLAISISVAVAAVAGAVVAIVGLFVGK